MFGHFSIEKFGMSHKTCFQWIFKTCSNKKKKKNRAFYIFFLTKYKIIGVLIILSRNLKRVFIP